jgi:hypothetical protein
MNEMYYYNDSFFGDADDIIEHVIDDNEFKSESDIAQDFKIEYEDCELRPIYKLDADLLYNLLLDHFEENSTEDGSEWDEEKIKPLIEKHFNFDSFNADAPELWFPNGAKNTISRDEVVKYMKENE